MPPYRSRGSKTAGGEFEIFLFGQANGQLANKLGIDFGHARIFVSS